MSEIIPRYPTVHVEVPEADVDEASAVLWELGASGVEQRDASTLDKPTAGAVLLVAHFDDEDEARIAAATIASPEKGWSATVEHIVGDEWKFRWKEFFKPTRIGERLLIRPSWEQVEPREGDVVLTLDPGQAFGTGTHETTRLVLAELESRVRGGERVLDAGCGSGILSIGALLLGAKDAVAVDVDELAIDATRENAEINGVADRVEASTTPVEELTDTWDLVVANIEAKVLLPMAPALISKVAPGGVLVLSGLLLQDEQEILEAYRALEPIGRRVERDWLALTFRAPGADASDDGEGAAAETSAEVATAESSTGAGAAEASGAEEATRDEQAAETIGDEAATHDEQAAEASGDEEATRDEQAAEASGDEEATRDEQAAEPSGDEEATRDEQAAEPSGDEEATRDEDETASATTEAADEASADETAPEASGEVEVTAIETADADGEASSEEAAAEAAKPVRKASGKKAAKKTAKKGSAKKAAKKTAKKGSAKKATKKAANKKATKKTAAKKTANKKAAKKTVNKKAVKKTANKKAVKKTANKKAAKKTVNKKAVKKTANKKAVKKTASKKAGKRGAKGR